MKVSLLEGQCRDTGRKSYAAGVSLKELGAAFEKFKSSAQQQMHALDEAYQYPEVRQLSIEMGQANQQFEQIAETFVNMSEVACNSLLDQRPTGAPFPVIKTWQKMRPLRVAQLLKYWALVESDMPMFDLKTAGFQEWADKYGWRFFGLRNKDGGKQHGVARVVQTDGQIGECSWKNGKEHGLGRWTWEGRAYVALYKDGVMLASFDFNMNFEETDRDNGSSALLDDLTPEDFRPEHEE